MTVVKSSKNKTKNAIVGDAVETAKPPQWPVLTPVTSPDNVTVHQLLPGQIVTASNFWAKSLCKAYVKFLGDLPLTTTPGVPKKGNAVRVNDRYQIEDPVFAEHLWSQAGLKQIVNDLEMDDPMDSKTLAEKRRDFWGGEVLGLNSNIRVYRYRKGQFFDKHYDDTNMVTFPGTPSVPGRTTWTLLLYLTSPSDGCVGGETIFYPDPPAGKRRKGEPAPSPVVVSLETGMALLHKHGKDCMVHEGSEVTEGEKWVIRSDLVVRR